MAFAVSVVQVQAAIAAYAGGESIWSRAQLSAVISFDRYARSGAPEELEQARNWLSIPLSDREARLAMESEPFDREAARAGFIAGGNHPEDVNGMIWLVRNLSALDDFQRAIVAWQETDAGLLALRDIGNSLEHEWSQQQPDPGKLALMRGQLANINSMLQVQAIRFREAMSRATRRAAGVLSIVSAVFLSALALIAWKISARLTQTVRHTAQNFRAIFEQAAVGIAQIDSNGDVLGVNEALSGILGYSKQQLLSMTYKQLLFPEDQAAGREQQRTVMAGGAKSHRFEQRLMHASGDPLWARLTVSVGYVRKHHATHYIVVVEDISESYRMSEELSYQANHDVLTGLLNRRAFDRHLEAVLSEAHTEHTSHALCFVDLDQFKIVNDTSGHQAGDELLRQVAEVARQSLRESDVLARLGGDEFGIILRNLSADAAENIAENLRAALEGMQFTWEGKSHNVGGSIGVVPITPGSSDTGALMRAADMACYVAKNRGRNRTYFSNTDDQQAKA